MNTIFDFVTIAIFAGLVVLFLKRSIGDDEQGAVESEPEDHLWQYLVAGVGCAVANFVGNHGYVVGAVAVTVATLMFITYVLRPFPNFPPRK